MDHRATVVTKGNPGRPQRRASETRRETDMTAVHGRMMGTTRTCGMLKNLEKETLLPNPRPGIRRTEATATTIKIHLEASIDPIAPTEIGVNPMRENIEATESAQSLQNFILAEQVSASLTTAVTRARTKTTRERHVSAANEMMMSATTTGSGRDGMTTTLQRT